MTKRFASKYIPLAGSAPGPVASPSAKDAAVHVETGWRPADLPPSMLTSREAANLIGISDTHLAVLRTSNHPSVTDRGPPWYKRGHFVVYRREDVERYVRDRAARLHAKAKAMEAKLEGPFGGFDNLSPEDAAMAREILS